MGHQCSKDLKNILESKACDNWKCILSDDIALSELSIIFETWFILGMDVENAKYLTKCV